MTRRTLQQIRDSHDRLAALLNSPNSLDPSAYARARGALSALRWALGLTISSDLEEALGLEKPPAVEVGGKP